MDKNPLDRLKPNQVPISENNLKEMNSPNQSVYKSWRSFYEPNQNRSITNLSNRRMKEIMMEKSKHKDEYDYWRNENKILNKEIEHFETDNLKLVNRIEKLKVQHESLIDIKNNCRDRFNYYKKQLDSKKEEIFGLQENIKELCISQLDPSSLKKSSEKDKSISKNSNEKSLQIFKSVQKNLNKKEIRDYVEKVKKIVDLIDNNDNQDESLSQLVR